MPSVSIPDNPDVLFCLTGDVRTNSRALRQLDALHEQGLSVLAVGLASGASTEQLRPGVTAVHVQAPQGSGPRWFRKVHLLMKANVRGVRARLYHASDLFVLPALASAAEVHLGRLTFDSRELYPHVGATRGKPWASWFWGMIERRYIRRADRVFTVNDSIADRLAETYRIDRPVVVPNVPQPRRSGGASTYLRDYFGIPDDTLLLLAQGYIKPGRGFEAAVRALKHVEGPHLVFLGDGPLRERLSSMAGEAGLYERVHFHPAVPPGDLLDVTASADVGLCLIEPLTESLRLSLPNKLFEYLAAGIPVVGTRLPEIRRVIEEYDVGATVDDLRPESIAAALQRVIVSPDLLHRWSANIPAVFETFDPAAASDAFSSTISRLLTQPKQA